MASSLEPEPETELHAIDDHDDDHHDDTAQLIDTSLPPPDSGAAATKALICACLMQLPIWGFSLSFGVLQNFYQTSSLVRGSKAQTGVIGATATGVMYLLMPVFSTLMTRRPRWRRWAGPVGVTVSASSILASSFASQVWQLVATQGLGTAIGCSILFSLTSLSVDEWFVRRKGFAYGVVFSVKSAVGVAAPFLADVGLDRFGYAVTLRAWMVVMVAVSAVVLAVQKPRLLVAASAKPLPMSWAFLRHQTFWMLEVGNVCQALSYNVPQTYLLSYARELGLSTSLGTLIAVALLNGPSVVGSFVFGALGDKVSVYTMTTISTVGSVITVLVLWGLSNGAALLATFSILYGFFAGAFSSTWAGILREVKKEEVATETGLVFGLLAGGRGVGFVVSGPAATALLNAGHGIGASGWGFGSRYGELIIFTGVSALFGGWSIGSKCFRLCC